MSENFELITGRERDNLEKSCTYLGMYDDPSTSYAFATNSNFCHRIKPNQTINLAHQTRYCLSPEYPTCPIYQTPNVESNSNQISEHGVSDKRKITTPSRFWGLSILIFSILAIMLIIYNFSNKGSTSHKPLSTNDLISSSSEEMNIITGTITVAASKVTPFASMPRITQSAIFTSTSSLFPSPTPIQTTTPSITLSPTLLSPTPGPKLGESFGPDDHFILHLVKQGESLSIIAQTYQTTVEVLRTINNVVQGASVWADTVIVVIPGQEDITNLTKFKVIQLEEPTDINQLAIEYKFSIDELKYLNELGDSSIIPAGRWLIIPLGQ